MRKFSAFIHAQQLSYAYAKNPGHWALRSVDLLIEPDAFVLVCGASGSGKSTLGRTFNGLIPHFYEGELQGQIQVDGTPTVNRSVADLSTQVGMVFQNAAAQLFNRTVEREIAFNLESMGLSRNEIRRRIDETAETMAINDWLTRNPQTLSVGEQQLVSIVTVLAARPQILVLDEPYANLDHANIRRVREALGRIQRRHLGVVICEHRLSLTVGDVRQVVILKKGELALSGTPDDILRMDLEKYGLDAPLPAKIGRRLGLANLPLDVPALKASTSFADLPADLKPTSPAAVPTDAPVVAEMEAVSFKRGGKTVLHEINLVLRRGECLAVVGANGAGKTTLLKHLNGLLRPSQGKIRIKGQDTGNVKVSQLARQVGMAFQNPDSQFFKLRVWDEISVGAKVLNRFDARWLQELAELFALQPLLNRAPYRLSGGEKKRVAFAAALACKPDILALDEPTAGQDFHFRRKLGEVLSHLQQAGQSIVLVTHDLSFAERHAHRWLVLSQGKIIAAGLPWEVMANEAAMQTANLEPTEAFLLYGRNRK